MEGRRYNPAVNSLIKAFKEFKKIHFSNVTTEISHGEWGILKTIGALTAQVKDEDFDCHKSTDGLMISSKDSKYNAPKEASRVKIGDVAEVVKIMPSALSRSLKNLESRGFVERATDKADRRNTFVSLTDEGIQALVTANSQMDRFFEGVVNKMGLDRVEELSRLLTEFARAARAIADGNEEDSGK